ncbi:MAG TPA: TlpA disulfide reductase family protein, partial [Bryobacteraceae bacterium]|nr:TlpA disulfide reductase family protein [Bryobacteraceae bacterium]
GSICKIDVPAAVACIALAVGLGGCAQTPAKSDTPVKLKAASERKQAPAFSLKDVDGRSVTLDDYKGKVVLLNFWATWCGPCKIEIPWFIDFEQKFKDRGFAVLGVSMDEEGWEIVKPYIAKEKVNYRVLLGTDSVAQLYGGVDNLPTSFILDPEGKIASTHIGLVSKSVYENEIQSLLSKSTASSFGRPALAAAVRAE